MPPRVRTLLLCLAACAPLTWLRTHTDAAAPPSRNPSADYARIQPLLKTYCGKCHNPSERDGGVDLVSITRSSALAKRALWVRAGKRLKAGDMPPEGEKQPTNAEAAALAEWMSRAAEYVDDHPDRQDPGPDTLRRLTRTEYDNTVRELFGIGFDSGAEVGLPADDAGEGRFENLAVNLTLSDALTEKYFAAAEAIVAKAFASGWQGDQARRKLFVARPGPRLSERDAAKLVITAFARRAYRRPPTDADVARLLRFYDDAKKNGAKHEDAVKATLKPVLVSPRFLFRLEQDRLAVRGRPGVPVDDHELAARLSYFLWASMPDDELSRLADEKKLTAPETLRKQVARMLADKRAVALTQTFGLSWMQVKHLDKARPTTEYFPAFTGQLKQAMRDEASTFFDHLRTADRSVLDLLDADYTFVNATLAKHYGIAGVTGDKMQKVALKPEHHRGGLLGMAAPLALTSHTSRTSPTLRGKYVLEVILGTPPPPPPPDVPALKEEPKKGPKQTPRSLREQLAAHSTQPTCAACHRKIDPLGFALDNYDAIGAWRVGTKERPLDVSGVLPGGQKVDGVGDLKKVLLSRQDEFFRNLAAKLLEYALGRVLEASDELAIRNVVAAMKKDGYKFSALVNGVIDSVPFRERRAAKP